ncbi:MAG TPA: tRNA (adenosine(37)-N6)-threonylcarbamoyltransferase complex dimerization subunit type 1 TsaB [Terriglobales bacterium]|jgi:tRNA threonylcarbamoyladenosine biosynthesis protein TsaB|nr:tRNA (adenosine(37)-N6)-threonylcarbamoyltransferase complex dimerization subunit type 1 TsaB [Terriglobales bacterium]
MLILAADTSGKHGSIALARCGPDESCHILEVVLLAGGTFSAQLVPQIAALMGKHGFGKQDIGGFAVVSGPGSFTGLRVGLAAIKALAEVLAKPIAAVSLLEAVALSSGGQGRVLAALDAGRAEVYIGEYEVEGAAAQLVSQRLVSRSECVLAAAAGACLVVTPDPGLAEAARGASVRVEQVELPQADIIARLGWRKIQAGQTVAPGELDANYIRRSDAEIFSKASS